MYNSRVFWNRTRLLYKSNLLVKFSWLDGYDEHCENTDDFTYESKKDQNDEIDNARPQSDGNEVEGREIESVRDV